MKKFLTQHHMSIDKAEKGCLEMLGKWPDAKKVIDTNTAGIAIWQKLFNTLEDHYKHNIINQNDFQKLRD
jgi:GTP cyclohydrolase I